MIVGIQSELLKVQSLGLLERLLSDKTTKTNIIWATDAYKEKGLQYERDREITVDLITGDNSGIIKNRARKALELQSERTKAHAEVFTPLWICRMMNDHADEVWFKKKDVFFLDGNPTQAVVFPKRKTWKHYVDARRLEITCGEAPYLVSRYDASNGEGIPIEARVGILDRKFRVVNENAQTETEWVEWAIRAVQATYGYEFQGDNLLIARLNLLMTFEEYLQARWNRKPTDKEYRTVANIIAWNIWQMDGLAGTIPYCKAEEEHYQYSLFELYGLTDEKEKKDTQPVCRIFDWRRDNSREFIHINEGVTRNMKFDFIIGNPPYQEESEQTIVTTNGQRPQKNIFHFFQMQADSLTNCGVCLIYPAGRWIHRSGKGQGFSEFGLKQINDHHLSKVVYYPNAKDVFPEVQIADGVSIVEKDMKKTSNGFRYVFIKNGEETEIFQDNPGESLIPLDPRDVSIIKKIDEFVDAKGIRFLHDQILPRSLFSIESDFVEKNPEKVRPFLEDDIDYATEIKLFTNDRAGKAGRTKWFTTSRDNISSNEKYIGEWQVVVSSANAGGQKRDNQIEIIDNHSAFGRARVALRSFKTWQEANNFYTYCKTYLIRFAFLMTDEALKSLGKKVPDFEDYLYSPFLNYNESLDNQLFALFSLNSDEIEYIKKRVDGIRGNRNG